jgi:uncharacterized protein (DUF433 family)
MGTNRHRNSSIEQTPGVCGGRPCVAGTGVSVLRIAGWHKTGLSPEEIADEYGHLTLAQVHAALAYYHANRNTLEAEMAAEEVDYGRLAAANRSSRSNSR